MNTGAAIAAEGVIDAMSGDHEAAADEGDRDFGAMGRKMVSPIGGGEDKGESGEHEKEDAQMTVIAITLDECDGSERCDDDGERAMGSLFGRQKVRRYGGYGEEYRSHHAMHDAQGRSPHAEMVCGDCERTPGSAGGRLIALAVFHLLPV